MPSYKIYHVTRYSYPTPVIDCMNQLMVYPIVDAHLTVKKHDIDVTTDPAIDVFVDYFGNRVGVFSVIKPHSELLITSTVDVTTHPVILPKDEIPAAEQWQILKSLKDEIAFMDFLQEEIFVSLNNVREEVASIVNYDDTPTTVAQALSGYVYNCFEYKKGVTNVETPAEEVWKLKAGVCQDFAHILLVMLRMIGIPSRYVSG